MFLSTEEERALAGGLGEGIQAAIQLIVDIGDFFEAEKLIPIASAHISGVSYLTGKDGILEHLMTFVKKKATVSVYSTLNPCGMDRERWREMSVSQEFAEKQILILNAYQQLGVATTCSCTPYDLGMIPLKGQHIAWAESSAICFANTYFGARTNKEDALSVLAAAITGKTPYYGLHITENRIPNLKVSVEAELQNATDYGLLGHLVGEATKKMKSPFGPIPLFELKSTPKPFHIKALGAALATFNTALFHIRDVTPEQELLGNFAPQEQLTITSDELKKVGDSFAPQDSVKSNIVVIGCPNASLEEIAEVARAVKGKILKRDKHFWVFTSRAQRANAEATGYSNILDAAGVKIYSDTCPEVFPYDKRLFPTVFTNSAKALHYIPAPNLSGVPTYLLPLNQLVERFFD